MTKEKINLIKIDEEQQELIEENNVLVKLIQYFAVCIAAMA